MLGFIIQKFSDQIANAIEPFESTFKSFWNNTLGSVASWLSASDAWNFIMHSLLGQEQTAPETSPTNPEEGAGPVQDSTNPGSRAAISPDPVEPAVVAKTDPQEPAAISPHRDTETTGAPEEFNKAAFQPAAEEVTPKPAQEEPAKAPSSPVPSHQLYYFAP